MPRLARSERSNRPTAAAKALARLLSAAASLRVTVDFRAGDIVAAGVAAVGVIALATHMVQFMHYTACNIVQVMNRRQPGVAPLIDRAACPVRHRPSRPPARTDRRPEPGRRQYPWRAPPRMRPARCAPICPGGAARPLRHLAR